MICLYAYTNHRADLDSLRRMGALWEMLNRRGIEAELLVNDYRAQLAGRELGLPAATTVETIMDIDAVAQHGDTVVIDSPENAGERMERYVAKLERVIRVSPCGGESLCGETVIDPHPISLPATYTGPLQPCVGLYTLDPPERLPVASVEPATCPARAVPLATIEVSQR